MPTNDHDLHPEPKHDPHVHTPDAPGYETTDVNVNGVVVFCAGLAGFVIVFFFFCFLMGKVINGALQKSDGPADKWHQANSEENGVRGLTPNPQLQQRQLQQMTSAFPEPRVDLDDGNQQTADLHAREDLMLEHYSSTPGQDGIRIPIERAMELITERGLPVHANPSGAETKMVGENEPQIQAPLTNGFARTGFEQDVIEARRQKMDYGKAEESAQHAQLTPAR